MDKLEKNTQKIKIHSYCNLTPKQRDNKALHIVFPVRQKKKKKIIFISNKFVVLKNILYIYKIYKTQTS